MIAMPSQQQYTRQYAVDLLKRLGYRELADEAMLELPDPVDAHRLEHGARSTAFPTPHWLAGWAAVPEQGGSPRAYRPGRGRS